MWNFVCLADENPWLNDIDVEDLNKRLIEIGKNNVVRKEQKTYTIYK